MAHNSNSQKAPGLRLIERTLQEYHRQTIMCSFFLYFVLASTAISGINLSNASAAHPRRILRPNDNVSEMIKRNRDRGDGDGRSRVGTSRDRYTIHTMIEAGADNAPTEVAMDVVEAVNPAVTVDTIIKDERGNDYSLANSDILLFTLLVTDIETADGADTFAMLAINPETDDMHGVVEKRGRRGERVPYKIKQSKDENNGFAIAQEEVNLPDPEWHCDVAEEIDEEEEVERKLMEDLVSQDLQHL